MFWVLKVFFPCLRANCLKRWFMIIALESSSVYNTHLNEILAFCEALRNYQILIVLKVLNRAFPLNIKYVVYTISAGRYCKATAVRRRKSRRYFTIKQRSFAYPRAHYIQE